MSHRKPVRFTRRDALRAGLMSAAAATLPTISTTARAQAADDRRFLFVICAAGGGSMIDAFLPVVDSESANGQTIVAYPSAFVVQPAGSAFRTVQAPPLTPYPFNNGFKQTFLQRHMNDMAVMAAEGTSVNHLVAQERSVTGAGINAGRTLMEAAAARHGEGMLLPNVNMAGGGFLKPGDDPSVPDWARAAPVADALLFPLSTDGVAGVAGVPGAQPGAAPQGADELARARSLVERARRTRESLESRSVFGKTFHNAPVRRSYLQTRRELQPAMEVADLITKLTMVPDSPNVPLNDYGLASSPDEQRIRNVFANVVSDPFEAQAALAFLLVRHQVSCAVTISPSFSPLLEGGNLTNPPLAFDFSHTNHPGTQYVMWGRILRVVDGLITLLKGEAYGDGTLYDRSLIYVATDFGRDKVRPSGSLEFGSGHHLNNGNLIVSPMVQGNRVYGGVDADTGYSHGFNFATGDPEPTARAPGDPPAANMPREGHVYSAVAQALDVSFDGRIDMSGMMPS
jgi:hypothetical protein